MRQLKNTTLLILCCILFTHQGQAQVMGNYAEQQKIYSNINVNAQYRAVPKAASFMGDNILEISINALSNQRASSYTAIFAISQVGKTADETNTLMNSRIEPFVKELRSMGVADADIYIDMVNFLPKYEYDVTKKLFSKKTYTEIPRGFELQKNVHIRYTNPAILDKIVSAAAKYEIYDIVKVDLFVKEPQTIYTELRAATFKYLQNIENQYKSAGMRLDSAYRITAENAWVAYPINRYESYRAYSAQALDGASDKSIVNNADKPVSRFYNAVPANDYDIVINPEILEPAVQFSYNLVIRFTLPERKPIERVTTRKEAFIITPNGDIKPLRLD
jgi:uncharacterized protein YggE